MHQMFNQIRRILDLKNKLINKAVRKTKEVIKSV